MKTLINLSGTEASAAVAASSQTPSAARPGAGSQNVMKFEQTGLPTSIRFGSDAKANELILNQLSYYNLLSIAEVTHMSSVKGMAIELDGFTLELDPCGNFIELIEDALAPATEPATNEDAQYEALCQAADAKHDEER